MSFRTCSSVFCTVHGLCLSKCKVKVERPLQQVFFSFVLLNKLNSSLSILYVVSIINHCITSIYVHVDGRPTISILLTKLAHF